MSEGSKLGDILKSYWESLPEKTRTKGDRRQLLLDAFALVDDELQGFSAPAALYREGEKEILVLFAGNSTVADALRIRARDLPDEIAQALGLRVDEVRVTLRPQSTIERMRSLKRSKRDERSD